MSGASVITEITLELRERLYDAFAAVPDHDLGLASSQSIALEPPKEAGQDVVASLYLYRVGVDEHRRNQRPLPDRNDRNLLRQPPFPVRLHYLFTPLAKDEKSNQILLGRLLQHLHDRPVVRSLGGEPVGDSHGGGDPALRLVPETLTLEQLSQLWTAFSAPLRTAAPFRVETVTIDSADPPRRAPRSEVLVAAVGRRGGTS